jgi:hypothetical protein
MRTSAWAATTRNNDFIRMEGLKRLVNKSKHRKEVVAGGLSEYLTAGVPNTRNNYLGLANLLNRISHASGEGGKTRDGLLDGLL